MRKDTKVATMENIVESFTKKFKWKRILSGMNVFYPPYHAHYQTFRYQVLCGDNSIRLFSLFSGRLFGINVSCSFTA